MRIGEQSPDFMATHSQMLKKSHVRCAVTPFLVVSSQQQLVVSRRSLRVSVFPEYRSLLIHLRLLQTISVNGRGGCLRWEAHSIYSLPSGSAPANYWISAQTLLAAAAGPSTPSTPCQDSVGSAGLILRKMSEQLCESETVLELNRLHLE